MSTTIELARAVREYVSERENPAPDHTMRRVCFDRMKAALAAFDAPPVPRSDGLPVVGEVWRERRREYARRTVLVTAVDHSFVKTKTLTNGEGVPPAKPTTSRVRLGNWSKVFVRVES